MRSHASIMFNALREAPSLASLVQVGVRDFCDERPVWRRTIRA